jgi:hypothetical protein
MKIPPEIPEEPKKISTTGSETCIGGSTETFCA